MNRGERDSHCSAHPLSRRAAGALQQQVGFVSAFRARQFASPSGARAVPHSPRAGGAPSSAVV